MGLNSHPRLSILSLFPTTVRRPNPTPNLPLNGRRTKRSRHMVYSHMVCTLRHFSESLRFALAGTEKVRSNTMRGANLLASRPVTNPYSSYHCFEISHKSGAWYHYVNVFPGLQSHPSSPFGLPSPVLILLYEQNPSKCVVRG